MSTGWTADAGRRMFAVSDVHVDFPPNMAWVESLSRDDHREDTLIVAGDLTHDLARLGRALAAFRRRFARVFFVPGNHELWLRDDGCADSMQKFERVLECCRECGVETEAGLVETSAGEAKAWVVPLFSWYVKPEEGDASLFAPKRGEDATLAIWADDYLVRWPGHPAAGPAADHFLGLNEARYGARSFDAPVVTFSHVLPRRDLIHATPEERRANPSGSVDEVPTFNFSRVAGDARLDRQLRALGSTVHVYGHQHRNRWRTVDGVLYVSNCIGTPGGCQYPLPAEPETPLKRIG